MIVPVLVIPFIRFWLFFPREDLRDVTDATIRLLLRGDTPYGRA